MTDQDDRSPSTRPRVDALFERIEADVAAERGPLAWLRGRSTPMRLGATLGTAGLTLVALVALSGRTSFWQHRAPLWAVGAWALLAAVAVAVAAALQPAYRPAWRGPPGWMLAGGLVLTGLGAVVASSTGAWGTVGPLRCLLVGVAAGLPTAGLVLLFDRRRGRGLAFGAMAGGLTGTLAVQLLCPARSGLAHQIVTHLGPTLVLAAAGACLGAWLVRRAG